MIDIICLLIIGLYTFLGWKRGFIKSAVSLIGTFVVCIIAWTFKDALANFLMEKMPFFNFPGIFNGITAFNILLYQIISFVVLFILMYCILNIIISLSKIVDNLLKLSLIYIIPSKIMGAVLGLVEGIVTAFLLMFVLFHIPATSSLINNSKFAIIILERTPVIGNLSVATTLSLEEAEKIISKGADSDDIESKNLKVLHTLIYYNIISADTAQKLIDDNKIVFSNTTFFNQGGK